MQKIRHNKFMAMLLTLVMALSLLSVTAFAEEKTVTTAEELKNAIADGNTITLGGSITANIEIPTGATVVLNLNGYTLTGETGVQDVVSNKGVLTVEGPGKIVAPKGGAIVNYPGATAVLNGGEYNAEKWYTIKNMGDMEIYEGVSISAETGSSSLIANGWYGDNATDRGTTYGANAANLTIHGGSFSGGMNTVKNDDYGVLEIKDGSFENTKGPTILNWNETTISGGNFSVPSGHVLAYGYLDDVADKGQFTIKGGVFTSGNGGEDSLFGVGESNKEGGKVLIDGGQFSGKLYTQADYKAQIVVSQGTFASKVDTSLIDASKTTASLTSGENTTYYIGNTESIAQTLADAAKEGDSITVQQGNASFAGIVAGVEVKNEGEGQVVVDDVSVEKGQSTTTTGSVGTKPEPDPESKPESDRDEEEEFGKVEVGGTDFDSNNTDKDNPQTGGDNGLELAIAAMLISAAGAATAFLFKQRKA